MSRKVSEPSFEQTLESLRAKGFSVTPSDEAAGGVLVSKNGAAAVLVAQSSGSGAGNAPAVFAVSPGVLVGGRVARLLDRGYQKFVKTAQFEIPATAAQLHAIHRFSEELRQCAGSLSLYNESLGTTSDLYQYDRVKGREKTAPAPARPWEVAAGH
ncbi:MAG: hypothetical protein ACP5FH_07245 [Terracidiphilus sp.]